ncbi:MAG: type II toxin-antitoxin system RelE/ParE family toxin [Calditrichaeota bacterium]|nr:type II toxin-antitoxin system RelE/ParE family toxin [Calditrichota bacterium]
MKRVRWTERSFRDLESIFDYIARDSPHHARLTIRAIRLVARSAAESPMLGRVVPEFGEPLIRERFHRQYRIIYRVIEGGIEVDAVLHGARLLV